MKLKNLGLAFAAVFILIGLLGFVPALTPHGLLLGIFRVDTMHNLVHLLSGIVAGAAALSGNRKYIRMYFKIFGCVYLLVTILGFALGGNLILFMVNMADNVLHLLIAASALAIGFGLKEE